MKKRLVSIFLIVFAIIAYINFRASYLEFKELGENYLKTFLTKEKYQYNEKVIIIVSTSYASNILKKRCLFVL